MPETPARLSVVTVVAHPDGGWVLGVIGKRTYKIVRESCEPAEEQVALVEEPRLNDEGCALDHDSDLLMRRTLTDVIVVGNAYAPPGRGSFDASIKIGAWSRALRCFGDRKPVVKPGGGLAFTPAIHREKTPLDWSSAFGGHDGAALEKYGDPFLEMQKALKQPADPRFGLYGYPRNPLGKGYLIESSPEALEACQLPNIEDPRDLLTPERLIPKGGAFWPLAPIPAATGWLSYNFFPRLAMAGIPPYYIDPSIPADSVAEVRDGLIKAVCLDGNVSIIARLDSRHLAQAAAPAMRIPEPEPGAIVELAHLHPRHYPWRFSLPAGRPRVHLRVPDEKPQELTPHIRTLLIEPDKDCICLVWTAEIPQRLPMGPGKYAKVEHAIQWNM